MYTRFFGFKERPFKMVPDPAYLYLSRTHQEAMAHLAYSLKSGDGFVQVTGEVGTGKTTLCRAFIQRLDERYEVAYIFNPVLDPIELLKAINDEFGIDTEPDNARALIKILNAFLIQAKRNGKQAILIIDEAQNLSRGVLEQIRLISNLETSRDKLLQIILFGQPELEQTLDSQPLRQLRQRMTLSARLRPLTLKETRAYALHRIQVAGRTRGDPFTSGAMRCVYRFSGGIPRLINLSCDRALLTAFAADNKQVGKKEVRAAVEELQYQIPAHGASRSVHRIGQAALASVLLLVVAGVLLMVTGIVPASWMSMENWKTSPPSAQVPVRVTIHEIPKPPTGHVIHGDTPVDVKPAMQVVSLDDVISSEDGYLLRQSALHTLLNLWGLPSQNPSFLESIDDDAMFVRLAANYHGLSFLRLVNDWTMIERLNLPAIIPIQSQSDDVVRMLTLSGVTSDGYLFYVGKERLKVIMSPEDLARFWTGEAFILWKNFLAINGVIPRKTNGESIITLKLLLRDIGFNGIEIDAVFDETARRAVMAVQEKNGLPVDGVVGTMTKIALYNEKMSLNIPKLKQ
ncbi:General secretion pathway protein A [Olavius algarvensis associated proteobacterium Delta 3]|nr:General secretion pathway protein A [Olavius algarvensis associated proteobacterium Delta 3]